MTLALLRKELRELAPYVAAALALLAFDLLWRVTVDYADQQPLSETFGPLLASPRASLALALLAFAVGQRLVMREYDQGTLELLDALPVSRGRVFTTKVAAAVAVLALYPLGRIGVAALLHALSRTSVEPGFHLPVLAKALALNGAQLFVFLALGMFLAGLRRPAWLVLPLLGALLWAAGDAPWAAWLDPLALTAARAVEPGGALPTVALRVQLSLAAALLLLTWLGFLGASDTLVRWRDRLLGRVGAVALVVALLALTGAVLWREGVPGLPSAGGDETFPRWATTREATGAYLFRYPTDRAHLAAAVIEVADDVDARIRAVLGADRGGRVGVELGAHRDAAWGEIAVGLHEDQPLDVTLGTLARETAVVYVDRLSDRRARSPFFRAGVARWAELASVGGAWEEETRAAAFARHRLGLGFEDLLDPAVLDTLDPDVARPLGATFARALADRHGETAPGDLLRRVGAAEHPELEGLAMWQQAFADQGWDLDAVVDPWAAELDAAVRPAWRDVPPLVETVHVAGEAEPYVRVERVPGVPVSCRFRGGPATEPRAWRVIQTDRRGVCRIPTERLKGAAFELQLGTHLPEGQITWERWKRVELPAG